MTEHELRTQAVRALSLPLLLVVMRLLLLAVLLVLLRWIILLLVLLKRLQVWLLVVVVVIVLMLLRHWGHLAKLRRLGLQLRVSSFNLQIWGLPCPGLLRLRHRQRLS